MNARLKLLRQICQIRTLATDAAREVPIRLYVSNLPWTIGDTELKQYFAQFGPISSAEVIFDERTGISRGFGYVNFSLVKSFVKALQTQHHKLEGKSLIVEQAKLKEKTFKKLSKIDEIDG